MIPNCSDCGLAEWIKDLSRLGKGEKLNSEKFKAIIVWKRTLKSTRMASQILNLSGGMQNHFTFPTQKYIKEDFNLIQFSQSLCDR